MIHPIIFATLVGMMMWIGVFYVIMWLFKF
jgi:hypothetical protein